MYPLSAHRITKKQMRVCYCMLQTQVSGMGKVMIRTIVIAPGMFSSLNLSERWISFGTGKNQHLLLIHSISDAIGAAKCNGLPFFHAFTGCDQVSFFTGKGKKSTWRTWKNFDDVTASFVSCSNFPSDQELKELFPTIERYVTLLYDQSSLLESTNDCRKVLFASKVDRWKQFHQRMMLSFNT